MSRMALLCSFYSWSLTMATELFICPALFLFIWKIAMVLIRRPAVCTKDLANIISNISNDIEGDEVDKMSVVRMLKSMYEWMTFDQNVQIDLPCPPESDRYFKMWPHGAVVNTRRKTGSVVNDVDDERRLRDFDWDTVSVVSTSVASSTVEQNAGSVGRGRVRLESVGQRGLSLYHTQVQQEHLHGGYPPYGGGGTYVEVPQAQYPTMQPQYPNINRPPPPMPQEVPRYMPQEPPHHRYII